MGLCQVTAALYREASRPAALLGQIRLSGKKRCPVKEQSGGQRQRLFIVLALIPIRKSSFGRADHRTGRQGQAGGLEHPFQT